MYNLKEQCLKITVAWLKRELKKENQPTTGRKLDLMLRLRTQKAKVEGGITKAKKQYELTKTSGVRHCYCLLPAISLTEDEMVFLLFFLSSNYSGVLCLFYQQM